MGKFCFIPMTNVSHSFQDLSTHYFTFINNSLSPIPQECCYPKVTTGFLITPKKNAVKIRRTSRRHYESVTLDPSIWNKKTFNFCGCRLCASLVHWGFSLNQYLELWFEVSIKKKVGWSKTLYLLGNIRRRYKCSSFICKGVSVGQNDRRTFLESVVSYMTLINYPNQL